MAAIGSFPPVEPPGPGGRRWGLRRRQLLGELPPRFRFLRQPVAQVPLGIARPRIFIFNALLACRVNYDAVMIGVFPLWPRWEENNSLFFYYPFQPVRPLPKEYKVYIGKVGESLMFKNIVITGCIIIISVLLFNMDKIVNKSETDYFISGFPINRLASQKQKEYCKALIKYSIHNIDYYETNNNGEGWKERYRQLINTAKAKEKTSFYVWEDINDLTTVGVGYKLDDKEERKEFIKARYYKCINNF